MSIMLDPYIILIDKPLGISSNVCLQRTKRLLKAKKAGHTGSLDPLASGMLPICLNRATKFADFLLATDKTYQVTAKLGITTTTGDAEGEILSSLPVPTLTRDQLLAVLTEFKGDITQIPPMYSALKHQGQPLYRYARKGIDIERQPCLVTINRLELQSFTDDEFTCEVACSKGTYIRTLIEDIGIRIGCGAHVISLRRSRVGIFKAEQMITLEQLEAETKPECPTTFRLLTLNLPPLAITADDLKRIRQMTPLPRIAVPATDLVALLVDGDFIGIGTRACAPVCLL
jgi:tRNA pseudouridine55 synthase